MRDVERRMEKKETERSLNAFIWEKNRNCWWLKWIMAWTSGRESVKEITWVQRKGKYKCTNINHMQEWPHGK